MYTIKLKDGRLLAFKEFGDKNGIPVIFQHGIGNSRLARHPFEKLTIETGIKLITVNRPGYGESSPQPRRTFLNWPPDIEQLVNQLKIDKFGVLDHSGGASYSLAIAYKMNDRVSKVVLASPLGQLNVPGIRSCL
jgi:pimeloyl-ACP methyl ester carboxylesterase